MLQLISLVMFTAFIGSSAASDTALVADATIACDDTVSLPLVSTDETSDSVLLHDSCEEGCMDLLGSAKVQCIKACRL